MSLENAIEKLAEAIVGFTKVYRNVLVDPVDPPKVVEAPKTARKEKVKKEDPPPNPYIEHISESSSVEELRKIARQELKRVVIAKGEKAAENMLKKYRAKNIDDLKEYDLSAFLTDAAVIVNDGDGVALIEVDEHVLTDRLRELFKLKGKQAAKDILDFFGIDKISQFKESDYQDAYRMIMEALGE